MNFKSSVRHGFSAKDYGLDAVAIHNATSSMEQFPLYHDDTQGLAIYDDYEHMYQDEQSYIRHSPTPRSTTASEGIRTRSGRSTRQTDSPFSATKSRVSKSPAPRKKPKKSKIDKSKTPKLTAPLSVLTRDCNVQVRDIETYVNRSTEERLKEMEEKGYTSRPMNSFMLYRSAYAGRTKAWCAQNNHQVVSSLSGESWPMESDEVRSQFDEWARIERQHHQEAHPNYKFSPSKSASKRRKGNLSAGEDEPSDFDRNPDDEYRGHRNIKQRRQDWVEPAYLPSNVGFSSHPYYGPQMGGYEQSHYESVHPGRLPPSQITYDHHDLPYDTQTHTYLPNSIQSQQPPYIYMQGWQSGRAPTPISFRGQQSLGGYGLPGGHMQTEDVFSSSRTSTPMQHYQTYSQSMPTQYQTQYETQYRPGPSASAPQPGSQLYEHQQYLQQASQPQAAIDPSLQAALEAATASGSYGLAMADSHFDDALATNDEYFERPNSPSDVNATLAPSWLPTDMRD